MIRLMDFPAEMPKIPSYSTQVLTLVVISLISVLVFRWRFNRGKKVRSAILTIRISHIPEAINSGQLLDILESLASKCELKTKKPGKNIILWSFTPSAMSADRERECVSTVTFLDTPPMLRASGQIDLKGADVSFSVTVDSDFFGLTPLSNPRKGITVDIIAVTGLAGHAFGSWKSRNAPTMWLRDFLPEHVPTARILTYGYDSALLGSESKASIHDFSKTFLQALKTARAHEDEKYRPIIFIGHSLGGLVIKQALARAAQGSEKDKQIFISCYGIFFFGVPNRGLDINALKSMVKGQQNSRLVKDLDPSSHSLRILHEMFSDNFTFKDSPIVSIFETKVTRTVVETRKGVWERVGPTVLMVPESSATYSGPTEKSYDQFSIDANHSDIVKFNNRVNPDYLNVRQKIIDFVNDAPVVIERRITALGHSTIECRTNVPDRAKLCDRIKELLTPIDFEIDITYRSWNRCKGTGDWLLSDEDFRSWKDMSISETLWLHGNPGCGKSYLMSRALEHIEEQYHETEVIVVHFFCDNKTHNTEKRKLSSLLKTLLSQVLTRVATSHPAELEGCFHQLAKFASETEMIPWLFQDTLKRIGKYIPKIFVVLDALDECDDVQNLLILLKDLGGTGTTTLHIIISSRESIRASLFRINEGNVRGIRVSQDRVKNDVDIFIRNKVRLLDIRGLGSEEEAVSRLIGGCDSLFLLAHFRVESLRRGGFHTQQDLDEALFTLPEDLRAYYDKALGSIKDLPDEKIALIRRIFLWVTYAKRRLSFTELVEAVSNTHGSRQQLTQRGLDDLCGGLLVFKFRHDPDHSGPLVELVHSTVKDYIFDFVWTTTSPSVCLRDQNECNSEIAMSAIAYMSRPDIHDGDKHPLLDYFYKFWILHLIDTSSPKEKLLADLPQFLASRNSSLWWNSPLSATLNGKISGRRYLHSRFHGWITNTARGPELYQHADFIITQLEKQVTYRTEKQGEMHVTAIDSIFNLASMYSDQGRFQGAETLQLQVVAARKSILGESHIDTLKAISNLAATYGNQARWKESEDLLLHVIATFKKISGEDHPDITTAMGSLVTTYKGQGRLVEAEKLAVQAVDICKRVLGEDSPDTLAAMSNLAATYGKLGELRKAEDIGVVVMDTCKRALGEDHPDTLAAISNLAMTYGNERRWKEAEDLLVHMLASSKRVLGEGHPDTLAVMANLVITYRRQREWKAEQETSLSMQIVAINKKTFGEDHPSSLVAMIDLAMTYEHLVQPDKLDSLQLEILASFNRVAGSGYTQTFTEIANLFSSFSYRYHVTLPWQMDWEERVVQMNTIAFGEDHPNTLTATFKLAQTYWDCRREKEAEDLRFLVMNTSKKVLGENHPFTLQTMITLSTQWSHVRPGLHLLMSQAMEIKERDPRTLKEIAQLATTHWNEGRTKEAEYLVAEILALAGIGIGGNFFGLMEAICLLAPTPHSRNQVQWKRIEILREAILNANPMPNGRTIHEMASQLLIYRNQDNLYR